MKNQLKPIPKRRYLPPATNRLRWYRECIDRKEYLIHVDDYIVGKTTRYCFVQRFWYYAKGSDATDFLMVPADYLAGATGDFIINQIDWLKLQQVSLNNQSVVAVSAICEYKWVDVPGIRLTRHDDPLFEPGQALTILRPYRWGDGYPLRVVVKLPKSKMALKPQETYRNEVVVFFSQLQLCPSCAEVTTTPSGSLLATS